MINYLVYPLLLRIIPNSLTFPSNLSFLVLFDLLSTSLIHYHYSRYFYPFSNASHTLPPLSFYK